MSTAPLQALAPAKINLGLRLGALGADGRHRLVTVMQSISLADELLLEWRSGPEAGARAANRQADDEIVCRGVDGPFERNLAARALSSFRETTAWDTPPLRLTIAKHIPVAAGLGGGSADAAAALRLAARASGREREPLLGLAASLGSDVPAQLQPGRWLASGTGERLEELPAPRPTFGVLVLPTDLRLSTADVYAEADRLGLPRADEELERYRDALRDALESGIPLPAAELLANDLEPATRSLCPAIDANLERVRASDADAALVSGSGPTVLGLFAGEDGPRRARRAAQQLAARLPDAPAPVAAVPVQAPFGAPGPPLSQFRGRA
jgi:4-diphosphocytidyl-2-C-methyl-D-erythritol kinase